MAPSTSSLDALHVRGDNATMATERKQFTFHAMLLIAVSLNEIATAYGVGDAYPVALAVGSCVHWLLGVRCEVIALAQLRVVKLMHVPYKLTTKG